MYYDDESSSSSSKMKWHFAVVRSPSFLRAPFVAVCSPVEEASEVLDAIGASTVFSHRYVDPEAVLDFIEKELPSVRLRRVVLPAAAAAEHGEHYATMESFSVEERLKVLAHVTGRSERALAKQLGIISKANTSKKLNDPSQGALKN